MTKKDCDVLVNAVSVARNTLDFTEKFGLEVDEAKLEMKKALRSLLELRRTLEESDAKEAQPEFKKVE